MKSLVVLVLTLAATAAAAQGFPVPGKPIRVIVGFAPGGGTDIQARIVQPKLQEALGVPVVIENKPGAGTALAATEVARAAPDGHTILYTFNGTFAQIPFTQHVSYDPFKDFTPISLGANGSQLLVVHASIPVKDVAELRAWGRAHPRELNIASFGTGTSSHIFAELLMRQLGIDMVHVPYKGSAPAQTDVIAGRVPLMSDPLFSVMPFVRAGKLKILAVSTGKRVPGFEQLPTIAETYPGFDVVGYLGFVVPKATPDGVVKAIQAASAKALQMPHLRKRIEDFGNTPVGSTSQEFDRFIAADMQKWARVIKDAKIPLE